MKMYRRFGRFLIDIGWFKGEQFRLFKVEFVSIDNYSVTLFELQVVRFLCGLYFDNS